MFSERGKPTSRKNIKSAKPEIIGGSKNGKKLQTVKILSFFLYEYDNNLQNKNQLKQKTQLLQDQHKLN